MIATASLPTREAVLAALVEVPDPEVPAISVVELGVVRDVEIDGGRITVVLTPTYSGCPAMHVIEADIVAGLAAHGVSPVHIETVFVPAWTSDWISSESKAKLEAYGIAAPGRASDEGGLVMLTRRAPVACPYCKSINYCNDCLQPFEQFKAI